MKFPLLKQALDRLLEVDSVCIFSHVRPDGDAYGSTLGLGHSLKEAGKRVSFYNEDGVTNLFTFLPGSDEIKKPTKTPPAQDDLIVSVDCSTQERLGSTFQTWNRKVDVNLDHHGSNTYFGQINIIEPNYPATSAIVLELIENAGWPITPDVAANLYVGISTDTGSFRYRGTTADTMRAAAKLIEAGADPAMLARRCFQSVSMTRFELSRQAMQQVQLEHDGSLAYLHITPELMKSTHARPEDTEGLIEKLQEIETVQLAAIFETMAPDLLRVSLRSKDGINVSEIAQTFGGGGHPLAAGVRIGGNPEANKEKMLDCLRQSLKNIAP